MKRREFLRQSSLASLAVLTSATYHTQGQTRRPPNIVFIMADDLGYQHLSCHGQTRNVADANPQVVNRIEEYLRDCRVAPRPQVEPPKPLGRRYL